MKGSRECEYPQPRLKKASKLGQHRKSKLESGSSSGDYEDDELPADTSPLNERQPMEQFQLRITRTENFQKPSDNTAARQVGKPPTQRSQPSAELSGISPDAKLSLLTAASSPTTQSYAASASPGYLQTPATVSTEDLLDNSQLSHLPIDHQAHLTYHRNHLTSHHYFFKHEANHFIHNTLLEHALSYEPLRFAIIGFAAFHLALQNTDSKIQDFLNYYTTAVHLLRRSLANGDKHTDATMMTILQLATLEVRQSSPPSICTKSLQEYLGDWVNVLGHQKAAYTMLTELYDVDSIMNIEIHRKILAWYSRFDLFAGLMSGYETVLGREWFCANENYYQSQSQRISSSIDCKIEAAVASHRVLAMDIALLFARLPRGDISLEDFTLENDLIVEQLRTWRQNLDPLITDGKYLVHTFHTPRERDPEDIVDPYMPRGLYEGALWTVNFMIMDWIALDMMHKYQTAMMFKRQPPPELESMALELCRVFEAIEYWPDSPPGSVLKAQAGLGIAALFLPRDHKHMMWCRKKMAMIEGKG